MQTALSILVDAASYGMVLFVISVGLSVTMGLMRVINLAHGAFAMIGGYIASYLTRDLGIDYGAAIALAVGATTLIGVPLERLLYRRLYGTRDPLAQVLLTIGITFMVIGIANFLLGPTLKTIPLPAELSGPVSIGFRTIAAHRLFVIAAGLAIALALWLLIERTSFGNPPARCGRQCGDGGCARRAHRNHLRGVVRDCRCARRAGRRARRRTLADRALLCAALHGDVPRRRLGWRRRFDSRRGAGGAAARAGRHHRKISLPGIRRLLLLPRGDRRRGGVPARLVRQGRAMNAPLNCPLKVPAVPPKRAVRRADLHTDATAVFVIAALTAIGWFAFPDDLAFASRVIATILFVLSLDLVTGYCGVATLGHSILFGAGAYAAGIANVHGVAEPLLLLGLGRAGRRRTPVCSRAP